MYIIIHGKVVICSKVMSVFDKHQAGSKIFDKIT